MRIGGVSFVSHSVIVAFTAGAAFLIGVSQLAGSLGVRIEGGGNVMERLLHVLDAAPKVNFLAVMIAIVTLMTVAGVQTYAPRLPGFLIALGAGAALAAVTNAGENGVEMLSAIPAALPNFSAPHIGWSDLALLASPPPPAAWLPQAQQNTHIGRSKSVTQA